MTSMWSCSDRLILASQCGNVTSDAWPSRSSTSASAVGTSRSRMKRSRSFTERPIPR